MGKWTKVGENLVRYQGGTIYLRAKVAGKVVLMSLETESLRIAKIRRDPKLKALRSAAKTDDLKDVKSLGELLKVAVDRQLGTDLKPSTVEYYGKIAELLRTTLPLERPGKDWKKTDALQWWRTISKRYAAPRANAALALARGLGAAIVEAGLQEASPTDGLNRKAAPKKPKLKNIPSKDGVDAILADIRAQEKRVSKQSALFVGFLAFSGCRIGEARECQLEHLGADWVTFYGNALTGTKNRDYRRVPISEPLRAIIEEIRALWPDRSTGPLFTIKSPRFALEGACSRLKIPRMRIHDLRHFAATWWIEKGVDVPTVSKWLGHQDGGVLAMQVYGHRRDDHSLEMIKKLE